VRFKASELVNAAAIPDDEARRLLLAAAGESRAWMVGDPVVPPAVVAGFEDAVRRRLGGEPIQYIEGTSQFGPIEVRIDHRALIPRPETEHMYEICLGMLDGMQAPTVVDLCTGSGVLALALKHSRPDATLIGTDISGPALTLAKSNGEALGLEVSFRRGDLFVALPPGVRGSCDLIVSNPPYVSETEFSELPPEIARYEPRGALVAGNDGLDVLAEIALGARGWLRPGGHLICEIGETQGDSCLQLFAAYAPEIIPDLTGRPRYVRGRASQTTKLD
jgi:release factor glutamine methyltransferase